MKVGILTFHNGINHGGFFQAFSTYSFLKANNYDVEIINYKNKRHWLAEYKAFLFWSWILKINPKILFLNIRKIRSFKKDQKQMRMSKFTTNVSDISLDYDAIVVGSDIVWNYEWAFLGKDPIYFGHGLNTNKLVSYAPSFGPIDCKNTTIPNYVKTGLENFSHLSVRDENSKCLVKTAIDKDVKVVLDPVFLYDTVGMENDIIYNKPFILIYAFQLRDSDILQIKDFAKKNNLKTVAVGYSQPWCDDNLITLGPFDWISYFSKASYILTSTFHGTLFSLKYKKNFITSNNVSISNKVKTILSKIGLLDRLTDGDLNFGKLYSSEIDYDLVSDKLDPLIKESKNYLLGALTK